ncbi:MAG: hypothetical protein AABZ08_03310 [Planctomycetota bacterium]
MASFYDKKKKCRVGTMDEAQFYAECDAANGAYFRRLLAAWEKAGGTLKWGAGGVGLRGTIKGKEVGICFVAPAFAGKKDRIELGCAALTKQIGESNCESLTKLLRKAAGDSVAGASMISLIQPGDLPKSAQEAVTKAFLTML